MHLLFLLLVATLALRELLRMQFQGRAGPGKQVGGVVSAVIWNVAWVVLLALAGVRASVGDTVIPGIAGLAVLWAGISLRASAFHAMGRLYTVTLTILDDHRLVEEGPYRFLRHPLHAGLLFEMGGLALVAWTWAGGVLVALSLVVALHRNLQEDAALEARFGDEYRRYRLHARDVVDLIPLGNRR